MSADNMEKLSSLSLSDKSPQSSDGETSSLTKCGLSLDMPCLILCFGSGIGITLVCHDCFIFSLQWK